LTPRRWLLTVSAGAWIATAGVVRSQSPADPCREILDTYCAGCHNQRVSTPVTQSGICKERPESFGQLIVE